MRHPRSFETVAGVALVMTAITCGAAPARAQNDWQFPDPYFGILEIEKSHDAATLRRYRAEVTKPPRPARGWAPGFWQPTPADAPAAPVPAARPRWRNRWRR